MSSHKLTVGYLSHFDAGTSTHVPKEMTESHKELKAKQKLKKSPSFN